MLGRVLETGTSRPGLVPVRGPRGPRRRYFALGTIVTRIVA